MNRKKQPPLRSSLPANQTFRSSTGRRSRKLTVALNEPGTAAEAGEIIRALIDRIVLTSVDGILTAQLYGYLAAIMACAEGEPHLKTGTSRSTGPETLLSVVAGAGFEPATFRL